MVDVYQVILVPVGVVLLFGLLAGRWDAISNWRESRRQKAERRRNLRAMRRQQGAPLEQVAANLRRLRGVLTVDEHRSAVHQIGDRVAYDQVLIQASGCCRSSTIRLSIPLEWSGTSSGFESRPSSNGLASCYQTGDTVRRPERFWRITRPIGDP